MGLNKKRSFAFLFFMIFIQIGCSRPPDCLVADSIKAIDAVSFQNERYFLFLRTSGFSEKEHFYELFDESPRFDSCGQSNIEPISTIHIDTSLGMPEKLIIFNKQLKLVYSNIKDDGLGFENIIVEAEGLGMKSSN